MGRKVKDSPKWEDQFYDVVVLVLVVHRDTSESFRHLTGGILDIFDQPPGYFHP